MRRITKLTELVAPVNRRNFERFEGEVELEAGLEISPSLNGFEF